MHNTGNDLESNDILDFEDNCENLDVLMNADQDHWTDRFGNKKPTIDYALRMAGFTPAGFDFTTGGVLKNGDRNKCVFNQADQTWYSWSGDLPYNVIAGSAPGEGWKVVNLKVEAFIKDAVCLSSLRHLVPNNDWTSALNFAISNYRYIIPEKDKIYDINGIITSRVGVKILGEIKINPLNPRLQNLGVFTVDTSKRSSGIKGLYVFGTFDLVEMLYIKSMGFNLIQHGAHFEFNQPGLDRDIHIRKALDAASVANLDVMLTSGWITQEDSQAIGTVNLYDAHPALIGYSIFDEPTFNNVSYNRQNERISALREVTNKTLSVVDNAGHSDWFAAPGVLSKNYDMVFIDVYPNKLGMGRSVSDILLAHTLIKNATGNTKLIPVAGCFLGTNFSTDILTLKAVGERHCALSGGNLAFWGWDPVEQGITEVALSNKDLRDMMLGMMQAYRKEGSYDFFFVGKNKTPSGIQEPIKSMELTSDIGTTEGIFFHALEHGSSDTPTESINLSPGQTLTGIFALEGTNEMVTNISIKSDSVIKAVVGNVNGNSAFTLNIYALTPTNKRILLFREGYSFTAQEPSAQVGPIFIPFDPFAGCKISITFSDLNGMGLHPRTFFQMVFAGEK